MRMPNFTLRMLGGNYEYLPVEYDLPSAEFHITYHGSGAKFDEFDHSHMGEGEGKSNRRKRGCKCNS